MHYMLDSGSIQKPSRAGIVGFSFDDVWVNTSGTGRGCDVLVKLADFHGKVVTLQKFDRGVQVEILAGSYVRQRGVLRKWFSRKCQWRVKLKSGERITCFNKDMRVMRDEVKNTCPLGHRLQTLLTK